MCELPDLDREEFPLFHVLVLVALKNQPHVRRTALLCPSCGMSRTRNGNTTIDGRWQPFRQREYAATDRAIPAHSKHHFWFGWLDRVLRICDAHHDRGKRLLKRHLQAEEIQIGATSKEGQIFR